MKSAALQTNRGKFAALQRKVCSLTEERSVKFAALQRIGEVCSLTEERSVKFAALQRKGV